MSNADTNTPAADPNLDARFSNLNMSTSTPTPAGSLQHFPTVADPNASAFWSGQDTVLSSQPAALDYGTFQYPPHDNSTLLAAQANNPSALDYSYEATDQAYWPLVNDTSQAGPSSAAVPATTTTKPFPCTKCSNSYDRKCDLECVPPKPPTPTTKPPPTHQQHRI